MEQLLLQQSPFYSLDILLYETNYLIWFFVLVFFFFQLHKLISFDNTNFSSLEKSPTFHLTFEFISKLCCF